MHSISLHSFLTSTSSHSPFQPYSFSLSPSLISSLFCSIRLRESSPFPPSVSTPSPVFPICVSGRERELHSPEAKILKVIKYISLSCYLHADHRWHKQQAVLFHNYFQCLKSKVIIILCKSFIYVLSQKVYTDSHYTGVCEWTEFVCVCVCVCH